jgi:hypothetical protein
MADDMEIEDPFTKPVLGKLMVLDWRTLPYALQVKFMFSGHMAIQTQ